MNNQALRLPLSIRSKIRILLVLLMVLSISLSVRAQLVQGEYTNSILKTGSFNSWYDSNDCDGFEIEVANSALYDVSGTSLYLFLDSMQGNIDSLKIRIDGSITTIHVGDSIPAVNSIEFHAYEFSVVSYSIRRIGIPLIGGEMYDCDFHGYVGTWSHGCIYMFIGYFSDSQECTVLEGAVSITNDFCDNSTELNPGLNWVSNNDATGNPDLNISCFNDTELNTEESGVWYSFTTPDHPIKIKLTTSSSQCDTIELIGTQLALFTSCDSIPIACSSPGDSLFAKLEFDCGVLEPNTTYYLLVDGWEGEQGICRLFYNVYEICEIPGCTDPQSCNYNPNAIIDDETCLYGDGCNPELILTVDTIDCHNYSFSSYYEGMWSPYQPPPDVFWVVNGMPYYPMASPFGMFYLHDLEEGNYTICSLVYYMQNDSMSTMLEACFDFYVLQFCADTCAVSISPITADCDAIFTLNNVVPDSANSFVWDFGNGEIPEGGASITTSYSENGIYDVCVDMNSYGCADTTLCTTVNITSCFPDSSVYGCTDPLASNYNPEATLDDGSCNYSSECNFSMIVIPDSLNQNALVILPDFDYNNIVEILWDFGDGSTSSELYPTHAYPTSGPFQLCCTASFSDSGNICTSSFCLMLYDPNPGGGFYFSFSNSTPTAIKKHPNNNSIEVWPIPAKDFLMWKMNGANTGIIAIEIYNASGTLVKTSLFNETRDGSVSLANLESGFYQVLVYGDFGFQRKKVIVLR